MPITLRPFLHYSLAIFILCVCNYVPHCHIFFSDFQETLSKIYAIQNAIGYAKTMTLHTISERQAPHQAREHIQCW
jgi:hypothetical protein